MAVKTGGTNPEQMPRIFRGSSRRVCVTFRVEPSPDLKRGRGSDDLYTVMMVGGGGNYRYIVFINDELIQFSNAVETILNSLTHGPQPTT
jgi:hypothetical protein